MLDLHLFTSGPYQINLARSYLAEPMTAENNVLPRFVKEAPSIIRMEIPSRHCGASNRKTYHVFIDYVPNMHKLEGIRRYWCDCPNGARTVGCSLHVAACVFYLSFARHEPEILRPAAQLTDIFVPTGGETESENEASDV